MALARDIAEFCTIVQRIFTAVRRQHETDELYARVERLISIAARESPQRLVEELGVYLLRYRVPILEDDLDFFLQANFGGDIAAARGDEIRDAILTKFLPRLEGLYRQYSAQIRAAEEAGDAAAGRRAALTITQFKTDVLTMLNIALKYWRAEGKKMPAKCAYTPR